MGVPWGRYTDLCIIVPFFRAVGRILALFAVPQGGEPFEPGR
jgi:hypothetical protein